jgi:hypothetical protein
MSKNGNKNANVKKNSMNWQQILFAGFALLIVVSMILSAFM